MLNWSAQLQYGLEINEACKTIWQPFLAVKESCFAWQILYQIPATNKWRHQGISNSEEEQQCKRCKGAIEDTKHCLLDCPKVRPIWEWVALLTPLTSQDNSRRIAVSPQQALLGEDLDCSPAIPQHWWSALRITSLWHIWLDRNADVRQNKGSM